MGQIYNAGFNKTVPKGAAGNQAYAGIFFMDGQGLIRRLTEAEGHEYAYNPEKQDINPIGQEVAEEFIKSYKISFGKDIIIKKGAPNYEFFNEWRKLRPTGDNAKLMVYLADFMEEEVGAKHNKYYCESMEVTCTVESANNTDAKLTVNFSQAGDLTYGVIERTDTSASDDPDTFEYGYTPSDKIDIGEIELSAEDVTIPAGGEKIVAVSFSPVGCPREFTATADNQNVVIDRRRQSVIIKGRHIGTSTVTIESIANPAAKAVIEVTIE
jgi:hypothetical protein